jgi:hypothetical protein
LSFFFRQLWHKYRIDRRKDKNIVLNDQKTKHKIKLMITEYWKVEMDRPIVDRVYALEVGLIVNKG